MATVKQGGLNKKKKIEQIWEIKEAKGVKGKATGL